MSNFLGDFSPGQIVDGKFTTVNTAGLPTTLTGSPVVSIYKGNSLTKTTTGVTLTVDFDGITGLNHLRVDTSADATFYATATDCQGVITTGTVGGASIAGYEVMAFSLENRASAFTIV